MAIECVLLSVALSEPQIFKPASIEGGDCAESNAAPFALYMSLGLG